MKTYPSLGFGVLALLISGLNLGCMGRLIGEGVGAATGASGKVVGLSTPRGLEKYRGLKVDSLTVSPGLKAPGNLSSLVREQFLKAAAKKELKPGGTPCLVLSGEIYNYESAGAVDTAIGPLEEVIIRATLKDEQSGQVLGVANLIGRAKSTTAGGEKNLSEGAGKALAKWLKEGGITKGDEEKEK